MSFRISFLAPVLLVPAIAGAKSASNVQALPGDEASDCLALFQSSAYKKAIEHCTSQANTGDVMAADVLSRIYSTKGETLDLAKAFEWAKVASEKGSANAQAMLGLMYLRGDGTKKDTEKAQYYIQKAIDNGNKGAVRLRNLMKQAGLWRNSPD